MIELKSINSEQLCEARKKYEVIWVNVTGFSNISRIEQIGSEFGLHRLSLEDVVDIHERPKAGEFEDYLFVVM